MTRTYGVDVTDHHEVIAEVEQLDDGTQVVRVVVLELDA